MRPDIQIENHGSLFLARPFSDLGRNWLEEHAPADDEHQYFGTALVVEPRYIGDLVDGMMNDGLTVE